MNPDEIVAMNVAILLETLDWSQSKLADRMGVPRHVVRDMLRTDRPQRGFSWGEIIGLCAALGVNLSQLVLPPEGVVLTDTPVLLPLDGELQMEKVSDGIHGSYTPGRRALSSALFGTVLPKGGIPQDHHVARAKKLKEQLDMMKEMFGLEEETE